MNYCDHCSLRKLRMLVDHQFDGMEKMYDGDAGDPGYADDGDDGDFHEDYHGDEDHGDEDHGCCGDYQQGYLDRSTQDTGPYLLAEPFHH